MIAVAIADAVPLEAIREAIAGAVDLVVHVERDASGGRRVAAVAAVDRGRRRGEPLRTRPVEASR